MIEYQERNAIIYKECVYTYGELLQYSLRYSKQIALRTQNPKRVVIFSENCPEYIFSIYGVLRLQAVVVPVDVTSTSKELSYILNDCNPDLIITSKEKLEFVKKVVTEEVKGEPELLCFSDIDSSNIETEPIIDYPLPENEDTCVMIYTSGTTGSPKAVVLSFKNIWYNIDAVVNQVPIILPDSRMLLILPLNHIFAFAGLVLAPFYAGASVYIADSLVPDQLLQNLQKWKITIIIGVPRLYDAFAKGIMSKINASFITKLIYKLVGFIGSQRLSKYVFKQVQDKFGGHIAYLVSGGAALSKETGDVFKNVGLYVLEGYGMTECAPMISFTRPGERKVGYCGRLLPGLELRFTDMQEICVKGPNVMTGYYNRPEETAEVLKDGWLYTGDTGELHPKYGLKITGRIKEIIVTSNGKNINPVEIESTILHHTKVIKEIGVFLHDDILQAVVYPNLSAIRAYTGASAESVVHDEIEAYNKDAMGYKRIKRFHLVSEELPKTRLLKLKRYKLASLINSPVEKLEKEDLSQKSDVYRSLKTFIDHETKMDATGDAHFELDLALDSLGRISLLAFIEEKYGIEIKENQLDEYATLNKLTDYIESHSSGGAKEGKLSWEEILSNNSEPLNLPKSGFIHWFMFWLSKIIFHSFYRFTSKGTSNMEDKPCLYVANHCSGLDGVFITSKMRWKTIHHTYFFAKDKHFQSGFKHFMALHNNIILMDINTNVRNSLQQMYKVLKEGNSIIIFPEGTRSKTGEMQDFKDSFAILSETLKVPVVPIAIKGSHKAMYKHIRIPRFLSRIEIDFLPAINPQLGVQKHKTAESRMQWMKEQTMKMIKKALNQK